MYTTRIAYSLSCTCGGNTASRPFLVSRIFETCLNHVVRSTASCFANGSHWVVHLWPNLLNLSIDSRFDLTKFHQVFRCPPLRLFHELSGSARRIRRGDYSVGLRKTWPNHFTRCSLIVMATHLLIPQIFRISTFDMRSWFNLRIQRRQVCSNTFSAFSCSRFTDQVLQP